MAKIRVDVSYSIVDGSEVVFTAPCNCSEIDGLKVYYPDGEKEFVFKDAHGNALTGIGEAFAEGALVKTILDVTKGFAYIQNADTNSYIEGTFVKKNPPVLTATPDTLADVMASAQAGATIRLQAGNYPLLTFTGEYGLSRAETDNPLQGLLLKYPENLTIIGEPGVIIAGISITSGVMDTELTYDTILEKMKLPGNLIIKYVTDKNPSQFGSNDMCINGNICLRNCVIDGLTIDHCYITGGYVSLNPDSFVDCYGKDTASTAKTVWHRPWAKPFISNVTINYNKFGSADTDGYESEPSAISVRRVNNLEVYQNDIYYAKHNGIQVLGQSDGYSTGRIGIYYNRVRESGSTGINVHSLRDAEVYIYGNGLQKQHLDTDAHISIDNCVNTKYTLRMAEPTDAYPEGQGLNTYKDFENNSYTLTVEKGGILIEDDQPYCVTAEQIGALTSSTFRYDESTATLYINTEGVT